MDEKVAGQTDERRPEIFSLYIWYNHVGQGGSLDNEI
jgi:hypothetical protein